MDIVERYKIELLGNDFNHILTHPNIYTFGEIINDEIVAITWGKLEHEKSQYKIIDIYHYIEIGDWILSNETIRKIKLKKLLNGFSRLL